MKLEVTICYCDALTIFSLNLFDLFFPMLTVKGSNLKLRDRISIQTAEIHIITFWMRSRAIEGMNPTVATKMMLGDTSIEGIGTQCIGSLKESKSRFRNDEMDETFLATNRAITVNCFEVFDLDLIANRTTVTATSISHWFGPNLWMAKAKSWLLKVAINFLVQIQSIELPA
jgi:hypothetical protein